ncbi:MAG TPA: hypothetical protein VE871_15960, partial [Longimicrobium sp.]|nr:hypothetical protein [Longimicrobium sp.]
MRSRAGHSQPAADAFSANHDFARISVHSPARIFPRLAASTPGDHAEREADRVANAVTSAGQEGGSGCGRAPDVRGRLEAGIQRAADGAGMPVPDGVAAEIGALNGRGRPLGRAEREALEPRFG